MKRLILCFLMSVLCPYSALANMDKLNTTKPMVKMLYKGCFFGAKAEITTYAMRHKLSQTELAFALHDADKSCQCIAAFKPLTKVYATMADKGQQSILEPVSTQDAKAFNRALKKAKKSCLEAAL